MISQRLKGAYCNTCFLNSPTTFNQVVFSYFSGEIYAQSFCLNAFVQNQ
ncbi:MAG: zinc-finger domain-containing protein [Proteobacteria bacterium]|nr:zinc-finger domain-containing protein [Pseudomonadota bacterium]